jgi:hypothetical protein
MAVKDGLLLRNGRNWNSAMLTLAGRRLLNKWEKERCYD